MKKGDALVKPDMKAVLERTHLSKDLNSFLLPIFEAVSNAVHGVDERFGKDRARFGKTRIRLDNINNKDEFSVSIEDNGIGLNEKNYNSFRTPFSGYKLKKNGRGFGRFIAFKIFSRITYSTRCNDLLHFSKKFKFDINSENEIVFLGESDLPDCGLRVHYSSPLDDWGDLICKINAYDIKLHIGNHFLPYFLNGDLPDISICFDGGDEENITTYFNKLFSPGERGNFICEIDGVNERIEYSILRIRLKKKDILNCHSLLFSASDRIVGAPRKLNNLLGSISFKDEDNKSYIVVVVVKSDAFESRLNDSRTQININQDVVEIITSEVCSIIQENEKEQIEKIKKKQKDNLDDVLNENPILRGGLRGKSVSDYVRSKPNNWSNQDFVSNLALERYRSSKELNKSISNFSKDPDKYIDEIKNITKGLDDNNKEALAEYVVHRKKIIEIVDSSRKLDSSGRYPREEVIHDVIFKRFSDSTTTSYFEHNLWLVDDALAFVSYVSSDRTMHGKGRKKGDKIADLAFFEDSLVFESGGETTISIVEFKRPSRDDYKFGDEKADPVVQVIETLEKAQSSGGIYKADGEFFAFRSVVRRFAYIIADIKPSLVKVLKRHDFKSDVNPDIYVNYRTNENIFIQVMGYDTLIKDARKRNQAFFDVLFKQ